MGADTFHSRSPIVRRERGPFSRWMDLSGGLGVYGIVSFEREIVWLREASTSIRLLGPGGEVVQDGSGYSDCWYGYLSSERHIDEEARELAQRFSISRDSVLYVEATLRVVELPAVEVERDRFDINVPKYEIIPRDWCREGDPNLTAWTQARSSEERYDLEPPTYLRKVELFDAAIWSSRNGLATEDQVDLRRATLAAALSGLPDDLAAEIAEQRGLSAQPLSPQIGPDRLPVCGTGRAG